MKNIFFIALSATCFGLLINITGCSPKEQTPSTEQHPSTTATTEAAATVNGDNDIAENGNEKNNNEENTNTELNNTYWKLVELNQKEVAVSERQREPHLVFTSEMRVHGSDGCNNIGGGYTLDNDKLGFTQMISTMMACPDNEAQAREFTISLEKTISYQIDGKQLNLLDESGNVFARFNAVALQ